MCASRSSVLPLSQISAPLVPRMEKDLAPAANRLPGEESRFETRSRFSGAGNLFAAGAGSFFVTSGTNGALIWDSDTRSTGKRTCAGSTATAVAPTKASSPKLWRYLTWASAPLRSSVSSAPTKSAVAIFNMGDPWKGPLRRHDRHRRRSRPGGPPDGLAIMRRGCYLAISKQETPNSHRRDKRDQKRSCTVSTSFGSHGDI